ncbi:MAG TPA: DUF3108 domain-containing protein [Burkholderiaceae bacterium]|jgi:hypothetical protein|nr:DUF3108 domain-containing protein [Burkholderiaceae bacterium]
MKNPLTTQQQPVPAPASARWVTLCVASVLLHILVLDWANGNIHLQTWHGTSHTDTVVTAALRAASTRISPSAAPSVPKPRARPKKGPAAARTAPPPQEMLVVATEEFLTVPTEAGSEAPGTSVEPAIPIPVLEEPVPGEHYKVIPPPSAQLKYDVQKTPRIGNPSYGHGAITWQSSDGHYVIDGNAGVLFITALTFKSEGTIDDYGVAPELYSEKRFRRSVTNTHFHRQRNTISFSASETSYPRKGGEQDRASVIWQLAGIGRGDGGKFFAGAEIDLFVAGVRDGEIWRIRVIGQEEIEAGIGKVMAWHVVRDPRPGSYDQKIDIWLAPQHQWYPAKLRYTETNGDYLDLSLSDINQDVTP